MGNERILTKTLNSSQLKLIQLFAALSLMGFWLVGAVFGFFSVDYTAFVSIVARAVLAVLSVIVILICRNDIIIKNNKVFFFYIFLMIAYSIRMVFDMLLGPFTSMLPDSVFVNDTIMIVFGVFLPAFALIVSRKYLNVDQIAKYVFWMGFLIILMSRNIMSSGVGLDAYEDDRVNIGNTLHTLSLVRIGAFEVLAGLHLLFNTHRKIIIKAVYVIGIILGMWLSLASGARGGLVALVVALGIYWVLSARKNKKMILVALISVVLFLVFLVPILTWLSNYFPVIGERMLLFVIDHDQSNRDVYRQLAFKYIWENPLFGYSYRVNTDITGYTTHNGILDVALALGIPIAVVFVFVFYYRSFVISVKMTISKRFLFPVAMALFSMIASMSGSSITSEGWHFSMCMLFSAYYYDYKLNKKNIKV